MPGEVEDEDLVTVPKKVTIHYCNIGLGNGDEGLMVFPVILNEGNPDPVVD